VTRSDRDYQLMMSALADITRRRRTELGHADQAYQDSSARAAGELARAESEAVSADRWAAAAAGQVLDVDREAARLWDQLRRARGVRALGEMPDPSSVESLPRVALQRRPPDNAQPPRDSARALLSRAAERIDDTVRPAARRPLPRWTLPLLPLLGALIAGMTALVAAGLVTMGGADVPAGAVIRGAGWLCFLLGGMIAAALLSLSFASQQH
jgi:hypothetical protein